MKKVKLKASKVPHQRNSIFSIFPSFQPSKKRIQEFQLALNKSIDPDVDYEYKIKESKFGDMRNSYFIPEFKLDISQSYFDSNHRATEHLKKHSIHVGDLLHAHVCGEGEILVSEKFMYQRKANKFDTSAIVSGYHIGGLDVLVRSFCYRELVDNFDDDFDDSELLNQQNCCGNDCNYSQTNKIMLYQAFDTFIDVQSSVVKARFDGYKNRMIYQCLRNQKSEFSVSNIKPRLVYEHAHKANSRPMKSLDLGWLLD
jgi:hypothetical protein